MPAKKKSAKGSAKRASAKVVRDGASLMSTLLGTVLNMAVTVATTGSVLLCLVVARHVT